MKLRPYQDDVYNKTKQAFMQGAQGVCCVLPCRSRKILHNASNGC